LFPAAESRRGHFIAVHTEKEETLSIIIDKVRCPRKGLPALWGGVAYN
jgi:hypothetical protein